MDIDNWILVYWVYAAGMLILLSIVVYFLLIKTRHRCGYIEPFFEFISASLVRSPQYRDTSVAQESVVDYMVAGSNKSVYCVDPSIKHGLFVIGQVSSGTNRFDFFANMGLVQNLVVGHDGKTSLYMFHLLCRCYNIPINQFVYIDMSKNVFTETPWGNGSVDIYVFMDGIKGSSFFNILEQVQFYNVDYGDIDMSKVKVIMPFAYLETIDLRLLMPKKSRLTSVYKYLCFDMLRVSDMTGKYDDKQYQNCIAGDGDALALTNMYQQQFANTFNFFDKVEQFANGSTVVLESNKPQLGRIIANINDEYKVFKMHGRQINLVNLELGDRVVLTKQSEATENGIYYVLGVGKDSMLHTMIPIEAKLLEEESGNNNARMLVTIERVKLPRFIKLYDVVFITDRELSGTIIEIRDNVVVMEVHIPIKTNKGSCVTDDLVQVRQSCESKYDAFGKLKDAADVWDTQCEKDTDCPFFQKNKPGYRGGCNNGYCEMPVGVRRIGYTKYADGPTSYPWCHGCDIYDMDTCCKEQDTPDYAFANDTKSKFIKSL